MKNIPTPFSVLSLFTGVVLAVSSPARADILASSNFATNPAPGDSRFTYNGSGSLTAHYNTSLPTDKLLFPLSRTLTASDSFAVTTRFEILSNNFFADPNGFAQIAFGLVNGTTTGNDRSGGVGHLTDPNGIGSSGDTYDAVTFDYFPNVSPFFSSPTLTPTVFTSKTGSEPAFSDLNSAFNGESALNDPGESPLPLNTFLNATLSYSAATRTVTLQMASDAGPLFINSGGGADGDTSTIEAVLPAGVNFNVNDYALTLWTDSYADSGPSVVADVVFSSFSVTSVPEPAGLGILALGACMLLLRRRRVGGSSPSARGSALGYAG